MSLEVMLMTLIYRRNAGKTIRIVENQDISQGIIIQLGNFRRWTLYLKTQGAINITVELSPDGGLTWFEIPESPISFSTAGDDVIEFGYDATHIKITGSNTTLITAIIRGVY